MSAIRVGLPTLYVLYGCEMWSLTEYVLLGTTASQGSLNVAVEKVLGLHVYNISVMSLTYLIDQRKLFGV